MKEWSRECHFYYPPMLFHHWFSWQGVLRFLKDFQEWKFKGLHDEYSQGPLINGQETSETFEKLFLITQGVG
jgi:hypothetical protein